MSRSANNRALSHLFMGMVSAVYLLDLIMGGKLSTLFQLTPAQVTAHNEFWRVFTFPLASGSLEGYFLFMFTFFVFASKLEEAFNRIVFPILLFFVFCLQGLAFTLGFWGKAITFSGMEGVTFFILSLFTLLHLRKKIAFLYLRPLNTVLFIVAITAAWLVMLGTHAIYLKNYALMINGLYSAVFGIIAGTIFFVQIRLVKLIRNRADNYQNQQFSAEPTDDDEPSLAVVGSYPETKKFNHHYDHETAIRVHQSQPQPFSEDRLNAILDKINEQGKSSLSTAEIKYLKDYSDNL